MWPPNARKQKCTTKRRACEFTYADDYDYAHDYDYADDYDYAHDYDCDGLDLRECREHVAAPVHGATAVAVWKNCDLCGL